MPTHRRWTTDPSRDARRRHCRRHAESGRSSITSSDWSRLNSISHAAQVSSLPTLQYFLRACAGTAERRSKMIDGRFADQLGIVAAQRLLAGRLQQRWFANGPHYHPAIPGRVAACRVGIRQSLVNGVRRQHAGATGSHRPDYSQPEASGAKPNHAVAAVIERLDKSAQSRGLPC